MTSLKDHRADLTAHLAKGIGASGPPLGGSLNPPAVLVAPGSPYLTASGYTKDNVTWQATIIGPPGDPPAVIDALDDLLDKVRATLFLKSPAGHQYGWREATAPTTVAVGDAELPAVIVTIGIEREAPRGTA